MKYRPYPQYKPSGIDWLGDIPENWEILKVKHLFKISEETSFEENPTILSLTQHGIKKRDISNNEGQIASSYSGYRKISIGDIVLNIMDMLSGFVDRSQYDGVISPAYTTLKPTKKIETKYYNYFFQKHYFEKIFFPFGQGVSVDHRWTLKDFTLLNFPIVKPTFEEQGKIAKFLDYKLAKIDQIIDKNNRLVKLLQEQRQAIITHAVTKGLNQKAKMKPSGIDWLGDIPEGWEIKRLGLVSNYVKTGSTPSHEKQQYFESGSIPWFTPGDFKEKIDLYDASKMITSKAIIDGEARLFKKDSILLVGIGATLGKIGFCMTEFSANQQINVIYIESQNIPRFYAYYLSAIAETVISISNASTIGILNQEKTKQILCVVPSKQEQIKIVKYINKQLAKFEDIVKKVEIQNQKLQKYRKALISNAVTGKIQV